MATPALSSETPLEPLQDERLAQSQTPAHEIHTRYQIESTVDFIRARPQHSSHNKKIVALQFPDELLSDSVPVFQALRSRLAQDVELYILADTTFGSCCVDEIAAEHVNADLVVHYGHACLSPTARLPVFYVFTERSISVQHCADAVHQATAALGVQVEQILLKSDVAYEWKMADIKEALATRLSIPVTYSPVEKSRSAGSQDPREEDPAPPQASTSASAYCASNTTTNGGCCSSAPSASGSEAVCCRASGTTRPSATTREKAREVDAERLPEKSAVIWIGPSSLALTHLLMTNPAIPVLAYEPDEQGHGGTIKPQHAGTNKLLMRRYAAIQRARDADVLGIVVGTLGIASYLPLVSRLRSLLRAHQKKVYTLSVGKPTPAKLANYQEVECFVLVACPENSLLLTSPEVGKEFYRTMVTPWEMEVALNHRGTSWEQGWRLGWAASLPSEEEGDGAEDERTPRDSDSDSDVQFSAATGKLRTVRKYGRRPDAANLTQKVESMALQTRPDSALEVAELMGSAAGERLQTLTYRGLDPRFGMDLPAQLEQGRSGMARGYTHENEAPPGREVDE